MASGFAPPRAFRSGAAATRGLAALRKRANGAFLGRLTLRPKVPIAIFRTIVHILERSRPAERPTRCSISSYPSIRPTSRAFPACSRLRRQRRARIDCLSVALLTMPVVLCRPYHPGAVSESSPRPRALSRDAPQRRIRHAFGRSLSVAVEVILPPPYPLPACAVVRPGSSPLAATGSNLRPPSPAPRSLHGAVDKDRGDRVPFRPTCARHGVRRPPGTITRLSLSELLRWFPRDRTRGRRACSRTNRLTTSRAVTLRTASSAGDPRSEQVYSRARAAEARAQPWLWRRSACLDCVVRLSALGPVRLVAEISSPPPLARCGFDRFVSPAATLLDVPKSTKPIFDGRASSMP